MEPEFVLKTLNRITERKEEKFPKWSSGLFPEPHILLAIALEASQKREVFSQEHTAILKYKLPFNSFVNNISMVRN